MSKVRGIRGATTVEADSPALIIEATKELLQAMENKNQLVLEDIAAAIFTTTPDLRSVYPAVAAREMGWTSVPLSCFAELEVSGSLPKCIRVLLLVNTEHNQAQMQHVYLRGARVLRPDLLGGSAVENN